jgi:tRNA (cytidine/uridine-2'-O-)-methyltransferase
MTLNIVLANPLIPQNTGNVARTCAATGARLHLIKPMGFELDDRRMKRSGLDYWDKLSVTVHESFADFFSCTRATGEYHFFETTPKRNYCDVIYADNAYLIFGQEDKGIPPEILAQYADCGVRIPMRRGLRSLNLSNTVAIGVYEVLRQWNFSELS